MPCSFELHYPLNLFRVEIADLVIMKDLSLKASEVFNGISIPATLEAKGFVHAH